MKTVVEERRTIARFLQITIIRVAHTRDAEALLALAHAFAASFVVDPNAFRVAF
jgi:hypothetical protein